MKCEYCKEHGENVEERIMTYLDEFHISCGKCWKKDYKKWITEGKPDAKKIHTFSI